MSYSLQDTVCVNTLELEKYLRQQDKIEESQEIIIEACKKLREEAMDAIYEFESLMRDMGEEHGLGRNWYNLKDELEISK